MVEGCAQYQSGVGQRLLNYTYIKTGHIGMRFRDTTFPTFL